MLSALTSLWCVSFVICHCAWATKLASPLGTTTIQPNIYQIKQGDQHVMYHYINDPENKVETESFAENKTLPHWTQWNWLPYIAALFVGIWAQCSSRATAIMETAGCWNQRTSWPVVENAFPEQFFGTLITASDWLIRSGNPPDGCPLLPECYKRQPLCPLLWNRAAARSPTALTICRTAPLQPRCPPPPPPCLPHAT